MKPLFILRSFRNADDGDLLTPATPLGDLSPNQERYFGGNVDLRRLSDLTDNWKTLADAIQAV